MKHFYPCLFSVCLLSTFFNVAQLPLAFMLTPIWTRNWILSSLLLPCSMTKKRIYESNATVQCSHQKAPSSLLNDPTKENHYFHLWRYSVFSSLHCQYKAITSQMNGTTLGFMFMIIPSLATPFTVLIIFGMFLFHPLIVRSKGRCFIIHAS